MVWAMALLFSTNIDTRPQTVSSAAYLLPECFRRYEYAYGLQRVSLTNQMFLAGGTTRTT